MRGTVPAARGMELGAAVAAKAARAALTWTENLLFGSGRHGCGFVRCVCVCVVLVMVRKEDDESSGEEV